MEIYLGFDPGGKKQFGWAVCSPIMQILHVLATGEAGNAKEAMTKAISTIPSKGTVIGVGIDAPLFWAEDGRRDVDKLVRQAIKKLGSQSSGGTVQQINSLRGACIVQGPLIANFLLRCFPNIAITESHPKALLYLLGVANKQKKPSMVSLGDLLEYVDCDKRMTSEHERDAILGTITAFAQREKRRGWRNLFKEERKPITPFNYSVEYWMPWGLVRK